MTAEIIRSLGGENRPSEPDTVAEWIEEEGIEAQLANMTPVDFQAKKVAIEKKANAAKQNMIGLQKKLEAAEYDLYLMTTQVEKLRSELHKAGEQLETVREQQIRILSQEGLESDEKKAKCAEFEQ